MEHAKSASGHTLNKKDFPSLSKYQMSTCSWGGVGLDVLRNLHWNLG